MADERPYICIRCGRNLTLLTGQIKTAEPTLSPHERILEPLICDICRREQMGLPTLAPT